MSGPGDYPNSAAGLPLVMELIDSPERIEAFLPVLTELAPRSLMTCGPVHMSRVVPKS